ncbi:hypothetical protein [Streptomyces glomeratus]|uniref:Uncharacterized protein n=1 Tax=Streptomyces glomeratus TaxID=284452 RepID=A0ABP6LVW2_9ACTN|nr:hypothetical protein [Streptomyces glomeratus]MCF1512721.1 hypothetical protein [Streptomyces glomeratus]
MSVIALPGLLWVGYRERIQDRLDGGAMAASITRSRRAAIVREAARTRTRCQRAGYTNEQTAAAIREAFPEVTELEAWRLALGWSRTDTITQIGELYRADGLMPPGLSESMLCRWEHDPDEWPGGDYGHAVPRLPYEQLVGLR